MYIMISFPGTPSSVSSEEMILPHLKSSGYARYAAGANFKESSVFLVSKSALSNEEFWSMTVKTALELSPLPV